MQSFSDLIDRFGGATKMATAINEPANTIRQWACRDSIPARCWAKVTEAAKEQQLTGVTLQALSDLASRRKAVAPRERCVAAAASTSTEEAAR